MKTTPGGPSGRRAQWRRGHVLQQLEQRGAARSSIRSRPGHRRRRPAKRASPRRASRSRPRARKPAPGEDEIETARSAVTVASSPAQLEARRIIDAVYVPSSSRRPRSCVRAGGEPTLGAHREGDRDASKRGRRSCARRPRASGGASRPRRDPPRPALRRRGKGWGETSAPHARSSSRRSGRFPAPGRRHAPDLPGVSPRGGAFSA